MPLAPQPYSPPVSYASPGGGCPCAPPPPPCCAPVQPCCLPTIHCCPPPPPVQCCPQPPVCCQPPPPPCCPPPVVCCSVPVIPTCFRACPACPCRRRLHAALRMKRSPGLHDRQCQQCTAAGQPKYVTRMKRQSNCRSCSNNPLLSLFAPTPDFLTRRSHSDAWWCSNLPFTLRKLVQIVQQSSEYFAELSIRMNILCQK
ncbi:hypothetical protein ANCCAN_24830 [Ancylostoma caninum]|uniref:Uncharacterized protein n=1 Tax=Ancylostoma caninum TaxID=29170 RepID=A0A368FB47_ANCCA|nr:hypothetical protein ANCCAN_24830 [Ancylostoma caninum]